MIIVTGAAGFIGSAIVWSLNRKQIDDILLVDELKDYGNYKKANVNKLKYKEIIDKNELMGRLKSSKITDIEAIIHMGACSRTTETDKNYIMKTNYEYTLALANFALENEIRFIYASSAATYGDGAKGFDDSHEKISQYTPLNLYGESKQLFDLWVYENKVLDRIVGLKYFNVYGPNEYHKKDMRSFVVKAYEQIKENKMVRLFKSHNPDYKNGEQLRDFIYIKDAVNMTLHFLYNKNISGIYNIGTGVARNWNDLVKSVFLSLKEKPVIEYIDMPDELRDQYQYYTCADMSRFFETGYNKKINSLEEGVEDYVREYLVNDRHLNILDKK